MFRIQDVLVPADLSSFSQSAWAFAQSIENDERPVVHLAHAVSPMPTYTRDVLFPYAPLGEDDVEFEHEMLAAARTRIEDAFSLPETLPAHLAEPRIAIGHPRELVPDFSRTSPIDVIVMGAFGESGVYPDALGSLAERVIRSVSTPVILMRDFDPKPRIQRITVASDLTRSSFRVMDVAAGLAVQLGATLEVVYVLPDPLELDTNNVLRTVVKFDGKQALGKTKNRVEALFDRLHDSVDVPLSLKGQFDKLVGRRRTLTGDPVNAVLDRVAQTNSDLLVVGTQKADEDGRARLGRIAHTLIRRATTHVCVVPVDPSLAMPEET